MFKPGQVHPIGWRPPTPEEERAKAEAEFERELDRWIYDSDDPHGIGLMEVLREERDALKNALSRRTPEAYVRLLIEMLAEIKATVDGESGQSVKDIIYGGIEEIKALYERKSA